jgi:hypothetical protein
MKRFAMFASTFLIASCAMNQPAFVEYHVGGPIECNPNPPAGAPRPGGNSERARRYVYDSSRAIEAYTDKAAYDLNEIVGVLVHVPSSHKSFDLKIYRIAGQWKTGNDSLAPILVIRNITKDPTTTQPSALLCGSEQLVVGPQIGRAPHPWEVDPKWKPSCRIRLDGRFSAGVYAAEVTTDGTDQVFVAPFVVRGHRQSLALLAGTNTWQAYNNWGGGSFYYNSVNIPEPLASDTPHVAKVSLLRPNLATNQPDSPRYCHSAGADALIAAWLGDRGYTFSMLTDSDLESDEHALDSVKTLILGAHPEYWSNFMYDQLEAFMDRGGNVVYLGADGLHRQVSIDGTTMVAKGDRRVDPSHCPARLLGIQYDQNPANSGFLKEARCLPYRRRPIAGNFHWVFDTPYPTTANVMGSYNEHGHCTNPAGPTGASGHEIDRTTNACRQKYADRTEGAYAVVASADSGDVYLSEMFIIQRDVNDPCSPGVFSVGSLVFAGSLIDYEKEPELGKVVMNVLHRFGNDPPGVKARDCH